MSTLSLKRRRDIARQKWQFIAVLVTVVLGVMMFAGTYNAYLNLGSSLEGTYERLAMADITVVGAEDGFVDAAAAMSDVDTAIERRQIDVPMDHDSLKERGSMFGTGAMIVLDEEHDGSFKQDTSPRYHARDVARFRSERENVPLILGSAIGSGGATEVKDRWDYAGPNSYNTWVGSRSEAQAVKLPLKTKKMSDIDLLKNKKVKDLKSSIESARVRIQNP